MLRLLLLKFLPRRVLPLLLLYELYRLAMRRRSPDDRAKLHRDTIGGRATSMSAREDAIR